MRKLSFRVTSLICCVILFMDMVAAVHVNRIYRVKDKKRQVMISNSTDTISSEAISGAAYPYAPKGIRFNGGSVMDSGAHVYIIWYGTWKASSKAIIRNFINSLGVSNPDTPNSVRRWWKITGLYFNKQGKYIYTGLKLVKEVTDNYSLGKSISSAGLTSIVKNHFKTGLPKDSKGIYLILTSTDTAVESFCTDACGYHDSFRLQGSQTYYRYAHVGNSARCLSGCGIDNSIAPNYDGGIDGMVSTIAHELTETVTDPEGTAWYDSKGNENADKCVGTYGTVFAGGNGRVHNMLGKNNMKFFVEQNWNPKTGKCAKQA